MSERIVETAIERRAPGGTRWGRLRGREAELQALGDVADDLRRGLPATYAIEGPPGSGKSRLLEAFVSSLQHQDISVLVGRGDPDKLSSPLGVLRNALTEQGAATPEPATRRPTGGAESAFWHIIDLQSELEHLAMTRPVIVIIDDLHWCDPETVIALRSLPRRLAGHAIGWICASRPVAADSSVSRTLRELALPNRPAVLSDLDDTAVDLIIGDVAAGLTPAQRRDVRTRSGGRPVYVLELARGLAERNSTAASSTQIAFGQSVNERLDALTPDARDLVQTASILGQTFTGADLEGMLRLGPVQLIGPLRESLAAEFLKESSDGLRFAHELVRESVESTVTAQRRGELRRQLVDVQLAAGVWIGDVALKLATTTSREDTEAIARLRIAVTELSDRSPAIALEVSLHVVDLVDHDTRAHAEALAVAVPLLWRNGRVSEAKTQAIEALAGTLPPETEAMLRFAIASFASQLSFNDAVLQAKAALELSPIAIETRIQLEALLAMNLMHSGRLDEATHAVDRGLALILDMASSGGPLALLRSVQSMIAFFQFDWQAAQKANDESRRLGRDLEPRPWHSDVWQTVLMGGRGELREALDLSNTGLAQAQQRGETHLVRMWMMVRCRYLLDAGQFEAAQAEAEALLDMVRELEQGDFLDSTAVFTHARASIQLKDQPGLVQARLNAERMLVGEAEPLHVIGAWLSVLLADLDDDFGSVVRHTLEYGGDFDDSGPGFCSAFDPAEAPEFARIAMRAGRPDLADRAAAAAERLYAANPGEPLLEAAAVHARGLCDADTTLLLHAVRLFERSERVIARAAAAEDYAAAIPDDPMTSIEHFMAALAIYHSCGDALGSERVRRRLRALGVSRGRLARHARPHEGWDSLSPSEMQVVKLVAGGATNRAAAAELFLSPHTVSTHLRRAFSKLGINTRVELVRLAGERSASRQ